MKGSSCPRRVALPRDPAFALRLQPPSFSADGLSLKCDRLSAISGRIPLEGHERLFNRGHRTAGYASRRTFRKLARRTQMSRFPAEMLPADLLARATLRGDEYAWPLDDIPQVIEAGKKPIW